MSGGFEFLVRRPLKTKKGSCVYKQPDGTLKAVFLALEWPALQVADDESMTNPTVLEALSSSVVKRNPKSDKTVLGKKGFCVELASKQGTHELYFGNDVDGKEWADILRKYSVHFDLLNGFSVTSKVLGTGQYSTVKLGKNALTNELVALKLIMKTRLDDGGRQLLVEEVRISQELKHKYLVRTHEFIELSDKYVLVMDYVGGGELFETIAHTTLPEAEVLHLFKQLLVGTAFLHQRLICHRDLKPENFLLTTDSPVQIKIADFGIAVDVDQNNADRCLKDGQELRCSPGYGAPEIVNQKPYGLPVDMWSLGVCLYLLLTGVQPFQHPDPNETRRLMMKADYPNAPLARVNPLAADLVARLLDKNPSTRIKIEEALEHSWMKHATGTDKDPKKKAELDGGVCCCCPKPQRFDDPSVHTVQSAVRAPAQPKYVDASVRQTPGGRAVGSGQVVPPLAPNSQGGPGAASLKRADYNL